MAEDLRHRYAEALASTNMLDETDLEFTLHLVLGIHEEEAAKLRWERDLAIAHDRQPYPTAWAYEQVCKARTAWQERAEQAEARLARIRGEHQIHRCEDGHILDRTPAPCVNDGMCSCGQRGDRCPTLAALDDTGEAVSLPPETPALSKEETT